MADGRVKLSLMLLRLVGAGCSEPPITAKRCKVQVYLAEFAPEEDKAMFSGCPWQTLAGFVAAGGVTEADTTGNKLIWTVFETGSPLQPLACGVMVEVTTDSFSLSAVSRCDMGPGTPMVVWAEAPLVF